MSGKIIEVGGGQGMGVGGDGFLNQEHLTLPSIFTRSYFLMIYFSITRGSHMFLVPSSLPSRSEICMRGKPIRDI